MKNGSLFTEINFFTPFHGYPHNVVQEGTSDSKFILYYTEYPPIHQNYIVKNLKDFLSKVTFVDRTVLTESDS
jgi:hypothetical protein